MKRVIIIHYWEGYPNYCWYPQTKKELGEQGFEVQVPEMPIDFKKVRQHCDKFVQDLRT